MKKGLTLVFCANIVSMILNVILGFILPKYLSIESYGYYKVFQLYINYVGIAHLGFADGIYLKYGGKDINSINPDIVRKETATIRSFQLFVTIIGIVLAVFTQNIFVLLISFSFLPVNMISFYKNLFQATGEFKNYSLIVSILPCITCMVDVILIFAFKTDNFIFYTLTVIFSNIIILFAMEIKSRKVIKKQSLFCFDVGLFKENIFSGITLTVANFANILLTSIDRWFIQLLLEISQFSYYSFAVTVENLFNTCVSAVTTTMYNYLCRVKDVNRIKTVKSYCVIAGIYLVAIAFPVQFIIDLWLPKYQNSISSIYILISAHIFYFVIKAIYINLYKAQGRQNHYLKQMLIILTIAIIYNLFAYFFISKTIEAFAMATLATALTWYFVCSFEFKNLNKGSHDTFSLLLCCALYLMIGLLLNNPIFGCLLYLLLVTIVLLAFERKHYLKLCSMARDFAIDFVHKLK